MSAEAAAGAAAAAAEAQMIWNLFKHQLKLTTGLLSSQYRRNENLLLAPNQLVSSLATLVPGQMTEPRLHLARCLFFTKCSGRMDANQMTGAYCAMNKPIMKTAAKEGAYRSSTIHYSHPSRQMKGKLVTKLWKKYRATGKELAFVGSEKANLQALTTLNGDLEAAHPGGVFSPLLSPLDYVSLLSPSIRTVLSSTAHFSGLWSKTFQLTYGQFTRSDGSTVKTPFLVKSKSYVYYHDKLTGVKMVCVKGSRVNGLALVLFLPHENTSVGHFIENVLNYQTLKGFFKKLRSRTQLCLTLPKFTLTSSESLAKPMQALALSKILQLDGDKKKGPKFSPPVDEDVIYLRKSKIEVKEAGVQDVPKRSTMLASSEVALTFDRPFLFALVSNVLAEVLMFGVCEDPTRES